MANDLKRQEADARGRLIAYAIGAILWLFFLATLLHIIPDYFSILK